ncbi:MAG: glycosyltransferase family 4 protein [Candidatus Adiutrix sp.]|jgi:alpha-1,3-rhamnosyl/mannosyltransferase|nr:glycosyltransferase family 4 protein [Candidatus Adiutrix sp.]
MKVILNIESVKFPLTGIGRYTFELGRALQRSADLEKLILWSGLRPGQGWPEMKSLVAGNGIRFRAQIKNGVRAIPGAADLYLKLRRRLTAGRLKKYNDCLYHGPNFYLPPFDGPKVVTIHDLSFAVMPQTHPADRVRLMTAALEHAVKNADQIITISDFSRQEIGRVYNYPLNRIKTTYLAASESFRPRTPAETNPYLAQYGLKPGQYSLYVGTIEPRKNIIGLLDAYERLPLPLRRHYPLVISGFAGWNSSDIHQRMQKLRPQGWLHYLDFLPHDHLPILISGAALFLFPSLYEGFGLPPLEAMQSGVPVLVSDRASLPEVVGPAAPQLDPQDAGLWREWIQRGLEDDTWRRQAIKMGLERAAEFTWQRCAAKTAAAYQAAAASHGGST